MALPEIIPNWIGGKAVMAAGGETFENINPADGSVLCKVTRSQSADIQAAVDAAKAVQPEWGAMPAVKRGMLLHELVLGMRARKEEIARIVHLETGKTYGEALGETEGAMALGLFYASEGQRLYGKSCTTGVPNRMALTVRQPIGIAGLIIAANTPIANVAWKIFPAMVCGNAVILKGSEDTPGTAAIVAEIAKEVGIPDGVLNVVQGFGLEAGAPLVAHADVGVVSFTGSSAVGRQVAEVAGKRLARVSLELGGKNPLVVCDDADLDNAVKWTMLSVFSNAGQRCAAASRIIIFDAVYDQFVEKLLAQSKELKVGPNEGDYFGPVINERQLANMLAAVEQAKKDGAEVLLGGHRLDDPAHKGGSYMAATVLANVSPQAEISRKELFGPICCLYRVKDFEAALALANDADYGLTACIHTDNFHRGVEFSKRVQAGVAVVNAGTYGSEPHMPFGGVKQSGNGSREPGTEALDVYSELKNILIHTDAERL